MKPCHLFKWKALITAGTPPRAAHGHPGRADLSHTDDFSELLYGCDKASGSITWTINKTG